MCQCVSIRTRSHRFSSGVFLQRFIRLSFSHLQTHLCFRRYCSHIHYLSTDKHVTFTLICSFRYSARLIKLLIYKRKKYSLHINREQFCTEHKHIKMMFSPRCGADLADGPEVQLRQRKRDITDSIFLKSFNRFICHSHTNTFERSFSFSTEIKLMSGSRSC